MTSSATHFVRALAIVVLVLGVAIDLAAADSPRLGAGIDPGAELILDFVRVASGGEKVGNATMGKASLWADFDSGAAGWRAGTRARLNVLATFGDSLSELAGDIQVSSNIEAPDDVRVFEAWFEQSLGDHASVLAGWNDFNSEFDVTTMAAALLNSSFGVGPDISQVGPSIFPRSYPGLRFRASSQGGAYAIVGGWHGIPYPCSDALPGEEVNGTFGALEAGWTKESQGRLGSPKLAAGYWHFATSDSSVGEDDDSIGGFYALAEAEIALRSGTRVGGFVRTGRALDVSRPIREYRGVGVRLASFLRSRPDDELSFGVARARLSSEKHDEVGATAETTWELNWRIQVSETLSIVPDVQYVEAPAGSGSARDAMLAGVRAVLTWD
jgi:porin